MSVERGYSTGFSSLVGMTAAVSIAALIIAEYVQVGVLVAGWSDARQEERCPGHYHPPLTFYFEAATWPLGMTVEWLIDAIPREQLVCDRFDSWRPLQDGQGSGESRQHEKPLMQGAVDNP